MSRSSAFRCVPLLLCLAALFAVAAPTMAQGTCSEGSPAFATNVGLWGSLRPGDVDAALLGPVQLPDERDSTNYDGHGLPSASLPLYSSVDIENDWVFTSSVTGFQVWNASGANAEKPVKVGGADLRSGGCTPNTAFWAVVPECTEVRHFIYGLDAPAGKDDILAVAGLQPVGMAIVNTADKGTPRLLYQDSDTGSSAPDGSQVHADVIGGREYAFFGAQDGLQLYDMTSARSLNKCLQSSGLCSGVKKPRIGPATPVIFVDGLATAGGRHFVATSSLTYEFGLRIWDVGNPLAPQNVHTGGSRFLSNEVIYGMAMWEQGGSQYLAVHVSGQGRIYNVTSCLASGCSSLPAPTWTGNWSTYGTAPGSATRLLVTFSRSGTTPFLYFGSNDQCSGGLQREFVFDVSNPSSPDEITPNGTMTLDGKTIDYWGWYYAGNHSNNVPNPKHGYSRVMPMVAKFNGPVLYRAAYTVFDTHVWTQAIPTPPTANFSWTDPVYANTPTTFNDTSAGVVTSRLWTFPAGTTVSNTATTPTTATFTSTGAKQVTLRVDNLVGFDEETKTVTVLDPAPSIGSVTHVPASPQTCQAVTFTANNVTGNPGPAVSWVIMNGPTQVYPAAGQATGNPLNVPGSTLPAGTYTAEARASNGAGPEALATESFSVLSPPALSFGGAPVCTNCTSGAPPSGVANLNVTASGATDYAWDCGDGTGFHGYNDGNSQFNSATVSCSYTATGAKTIKAKIKNCGGELTSADLNVTINQVQPVTIDQFLAQGCLFGFCSFGVNQTITFNVQVSGGATLYEANWNGDGSTWATVTPQNNTLTHSYGQAGAYNPKLRVRRNAEPYITATHIGIIIDGSPPPPPPPPQITIGGPSTGQANQSLGFSASANNCTPAATWSWSATGGGVVTGTGSSVSITWASDGSKTVSVTNSGCSGATGTKNVQIGTGNPNNGLGANFTVSPASPNVGQQVTLDGGSSTGSPTGYTWLLPGGETRTGQTTTVTFSSAGTFPVTLEVSKAGTGAGCSFGICTASVTKPITVGGGGGGTGTPLVPDFTTTPASPKVGDEVTLDAGPSQGSPTGFTWTLPGGVIKNGQTVKFTFGTAGTHAVSLEISKLAPATECPPIGVCLASVTKNVQVGAQAAATKSVVLPWIAQTRGLLEQTSDLYIHNPGTSAMNVTLEFRKKGAPETNPPKSTKTIQPGATLYVADVLKELFNKENIAGFISLTVEQGVAPVITSFNTTFDNSGKEFGQTVGGVPMTSGTSGAEDKFQNLVGLVSNSERLAYFGLSNPSDQPTTYKLRFFDKTGRQIGSDSQDFILSRFGQKQFQSKEISDDFGVSNVADYRVEIETKAGGHLVPYASNLRLASEDPSFILAGASRAAKVYLIGALSAPGLNNSLWQTDALLSNPSGEPVIADLTFTGVGLNGTTTAPFRLTLTPGQTERLENVIAGRWGINNAIGVLTISTISSGAFPIVQGESYDNTDPTKRYGQSMMAVSEANAASAGQGQYLVGLRQNAENRTTFWVYNNGTGTAEYDVIYRRLDGTPLGDPVNVRLGAGKLRQFSPGQHPLPAGGVADGFTVQIQVKSGKVLSSAQVINNLTNDPAYIQGEVR